MPLTAAEELEIIGLASLPPWFSESDRVREEAGMMAAQLAAVKNCIAQRVANIYIGLAAGPTSEEPDWLNLLARDRGTTRQANESTDQLRLRLQTIPSGIIASELLASVASLVEGAGILDPVVMLEFPRDAAYLGTWQGSGSTAGTFYKTGDAMAFLPDTAITWPPYSAARRGLVASQTITLSGSSAPGNDGTFAITGLSSVADGLGADTLTAIHYTNAGGSAGYDGGATYALDRLNWKGIAMNGWARAYVNRGFRLWRGQGTGGAMKAMGGFLVILPYGASEALRLGVLEMLRSKKAAGMRCILERRVGAIP